MKPKDVIPNAVAANKLVVIAGPCSIHEWEGPNIIAKRMHVLQARVQSKIQLVMRAYIDKPRTGEGWDGIIHEDEPATIRSKLIELSNHIPIGTEVLDLERLDALVLDDYLAFGCIGARTVSSQVHRRYANKSVYPFIFKNSMDGTIFDASAACKRASGNPCVGIMLRGGQHGPNYDLDSVKLTNLMVDTIPNALVYIDCSHGNSCKDFTKQAKVFEEGLTHFKLNMVQGLMLEMNLNEGRTDSVNQVGTSVTDACISWTTFEHLILNAYRTLCGDKDESTSGSKEEH